MENSTQIQFIETYGQDGPIGIIDVDTSVQFPINFAVGDIKDPFAKKGVKSYKFSIVGSKETNQLLNHYYDINIVDGTYNNNKKQKVAILRNGVIILDNAYMQLLNIKKQTHDVYSDQQIIYDIEVGDDVTSFFTKITNNFLEDLDFSDMTHTYEAAEVIASFPNSAVRDNVLGTGGYKYVLAWTPLTKYQLEECRPAISVYEYWNRIHQAAGYQWEWDRFDSNQIRMDKLWIPYNGDVPKVSDQLVNLVAADNSAPLVFVGAGQEIARQSFIIDNEVQDLSNAYNPITGIYTSAIFTGGSSFDITFEVTYSLSLNNPTASPVYLTATMGLGASTQYMRYRGSFDMFNNTAAAAGLPRSTFAASANTIYLEEYFYTSTAAPFTLPSGNTVVATGTIQTTTLPITNVLFNDDLVTRIALKRTDSGVEFHTSMVGGTIVTVVPTLTITDIKMIIVPRVDAYGYNTQVLMNDFVPRKIKQSDFIKAIVNMYNLVIVPDSTNDRKIIYQTRDDYYDSGIEKDWTDKIATDKGSDISFISNTNSKKITLSYKPDTDVVNKDYLAETKEVYGQQEYILQNENIKGLETKEIIFSPTPIDNTSFGTYAPMYAGKFPKCNIRVLLDGGEQPTGLAGAMTYDIINYNIGTLEYGVFGVDTYPMLTHQDNPNTPLFDINFGLCDKYYHDFTSVTNNNLYSMFWRRTIGQVDNGKLFTAYFYLNEYDISILKLNDKIFVKDTWYNINSLQYDPNSFGPTKVVLMTIDDELAIDIIKPRPGFPLLGTETLSDLSGQVYGGLNWNYGDSSVLVMGTGNIITGDIKNVVVVGNNRMVEESNTVYSENVVAENITLNGKDLQEVFNGVLIDATISIPSADVLTLFTTPYLLIPSPGIGYFIQVLTASCKVDFNSIAYATSTTLNIYTDTATRIQHVLNNVLNATASRISVSAQQGIFAAADTQLISDKAVYLTSSGFDPTAGDSDIVIYLSYKIIQE
jgi:hypothetical protein